MTIKNWIPLESNPDVLNAYASKVGLELTSFSFCDVYGLDEVQVTRSHAAARPSPWHRPMHLHASRTCLSFPLRSPPIAPDIAP